MHKREIYKIGLSLLIALVFLLPMGITANTTEKDEASVNTVVDPDYINNPVSQASTPVYIVEMTEPVLGGPNHDSIAGGCTPINITIANPDNGPAKVKAFCDIYKKTTGIKVLMYETSFEDNFDIYNNWVQIDADCGLIGGQYDSWTWTDARAYCDDHSFKSTMYDVYKGNQRDYFQCTKSFDVHEQDGIEIEFMAWVEADAGTLGWADPLTGHITLWDYLDFEIGDDQGNWINPADVLDNTKVPPAQQGYFIMDTTGVYTYTYPYIYTYPGSYYFFDTTYDIYSSRYFLDYRNYAEDMGDGWWKIHYTATIAQLQAMQLNINDIMFRFSWVTDPEFQFEGAYVDCVKVYSIEKMEEKVFQTHSQGNFTVPQGMHNYFVFPMEWCPETGDKDNLYDIRLWIEIENVDLNHHSASDWKQYPDIPVYVTDWFDVEVTRLKIESSFGGNMLLDTGDSPNVVPDTDVTMEYGDDLHIMTTVHADGTLPVPNIPVTASAYAKHWEDILFCDFEGQSPFMTTTGNAHITSKSAYSGTKSLGFFNEDYMRYLPTDTTNYAYGPMLDFSNDAQIYIDYYWKGLTENTLNSSAVSDKAWVMLYDDHYGYLAGRWYANDKGLFMGGYQPDWIGPNVPACRYQRIDLTDYWHFYQRHKFFLDEYGDPMYRLPLGFCFSTDGDTNNFNALAQSKGILWSGVYIDDVHVYQEVLDDTPVWTQTVIIPGPIEPCETIDETDGLQFEWENIPYCNYLLKISTNPTGACGNLEDPDESAQIHVYTKLERAVPKEVEFYDYSSFNYGQFGISSSDTDHYIASNYDREIYQANANYVLQLCPEDAKYTTDIAHKCLNLTGQTTVPMYFDAWWEIESQSDYFYIEVAACGANDYADWKLLDIRFQAGGGDPCPVGAFLTGSSLYTGPPYSDADNWYIQPNGLMVDLLAPFGGVCPAGGVEVRLRFTSDAGWNYRGIKLDDFSIPYLGFKDACDTLDNWCAPVPFSYGSFWTYTGTQWCWQPPAAKDFNDAMVWSTSVADSFWAEFCFEYKNLLTAGQVLVEISSDGGAHWDAAICKFNTTYRTGTGKYCYDLGKYVGKDILIRFRATPNTYVSASTTVNGLFCVWNMTIGGKKDAFGPVTTMTMSGTMKGSGWYTTPVKVVITAEDFGGAGMGDIHYILDGTEKVVAGNKAEFTVSGNGQHTLQYWGVDKVGNVEPTHTAQSFKIDSGAKPTVSISAPTPGIYFNGKKLMSSSNIVIIGGFTVEASASDADSGIYRVSFYLDDTVVADDTTAPFSAYICSKHRGAGTIKVVAEDFAQNTAEASLTLKYFKFF